MFYIPVNILPWFGSGRGVGILTYKNDFSNSLHWGNINQQPHKGASKACQNPHLCPIPPRAKYWHVHYMLFCGSTADGRAISFKMCKWEIFQKKHDFLILGRQSIHKQGFQTIHDVTFRWTSPVTFNHCMSKFACINWPISGTIVYHDSAMFGQLRVFCQSEHVHDKKTQIRLFLNEWLQ